MHFKSLIHTCLSRTERDRAHAIEKDVRFSHPKNPEHLLNLVVGQSAKLQDANVETPNGTIALVVNDRTLITWKTA